MLTFQTTPLTLWLGIFTLLIGGFLCAASYLRGPRKARFAGLEGLRFLIIGLAVALLWQPVWRTVIHPEDQAKIVVLWDGTGSMQTLDEKAFGDAADASDIGSRAEWVKEALASELWQPLRQDGQKELEIRSFGTDEAVLKDSLKGTDLSEPLNKLLETEDNLQAVILLSDGDYNLGSPPVAAAQKYRLRGVPIFPISVGQEVRLPDLDLLSISAPTYGIIGENVQIPFTIRSSLKQPVRALVKLRDGSGKERTKSIVIAPNAETFDSILWKLEKEGSSTLELIIPVQLGELVKSNNRQKFSITGKPEKIRVLVLETLPRWEFRFLRNALSRDPGVDLDCLLLRPDLGPAAGVDYLSEFPASLDGLSKYDVIFVGDIGIGEGQLNADQCEQIRGLVENQASGLVFLPGPQGNQRTLVDSALGDIIPVVLDVGASEGFSENIATPLNLTSAGRSSLLTLLAESEEDNPEIWRRLPGFFWHAPVIRAKGGTEVLAVHANRRGQYGQIPLMVTSVAGSGKILFMGIDSAWRWRRGVEDLYHYRFWGQVARWMSYQRNMAAGQRVRLFFNPERPVPGAFVSLNANAFSENGAPLSEGRVYVDIISPEGKAERIQLEKNESEWGAYTGKFRLAEAGEWKLRAVVSGAEEYPTETKIISQSTEIEKRGQPARPEVLGEIAKVSRGQMVRPEELASLIDLIDGLPEPKPLESQVQLWAHWAVVSGMILLLSIFWIGRKLSGNF